MSAGRAVAVRLQLRLLDQLVVTRAGVGPVACFGGSRQRCAPVSALVALRRPFLCYAVASLILLYTRAAITLGWSRCDAVCKELGGQERNRQLFFFLVFSPGGLAAFITELPNRQQRRSKLYTAASLSLKCAGFQQTSAIPQTTSVAAVCTLMQRTAPCLRRLAVKLQSAPGGLWPAQPWSLQAARAGHVIEAEIINSQVRLVQAAQACSLRWAACIQNELCMLTLR